MDLGQAITSRTNARVKALRGAFGGKATKAGDLAGVEGEHLIAEAVRSGLALETVFVRAGSEAVLERPALRGLSAGQWALLSAEVFDSAVETASPQGIAATIRVPEIKVLDVTANPGVFVYVENIQDPGNLGTLLRSAEAFGVRCLYASPATVNAWNPKAIRASAGSVFRLRVFTAALPEFADIVQRGGLRTVAAVARGAGAVASHEADLQAPCAVMIGNEGAGLSAAALAVAQLRVHIPCAVESLNAAIAGSVLMYEAARQNRRMFPGGAA